LALSDSAYIAASFNSSIKKNKFIILSNFESLLTYYAKRFVPKLVEWVMDKSVIAVQKKRGQ
jgi:hypothetical protein